jgi:hypothetical protein
MDTAAVVLLTIYFVGVVLTAATGLAYRAENSRYPDERRWGARLAVLSPLWPFLALRWVGREFGAVVLDATRRTDD